MPSELADVDYLAEGKIVNDMGEQMASPTRRLLAWTAPAALALAALVPALPAPAAAKPKPAPVVTTGPVDKDLNGDGVPDLIAVGGPGTGLGSGVWSALGVKSRKTGVGTGQVQTPATNIGLHGNGVTGNNSPADFDGAQVFTGRFAGVDRQDFVYYNPAGVSAGNGGLIIGAGDGTMTNPNLSGNQCTIGYDNLIDANGNIPLQLTNAFQADGVDNGIPDLLGISGDPTNGYRLGYHPSWPAPCLYYGVTTLTNPTPTGGTDWQNWSIASTETSSGAALFLRNATTGDLYLWTGVTMVDNGDGTGSLTRTQYQVAANWNTGVAIGTLEAADINADGTPDLWTVMTDGTYRAYLISGLSTSGTATVTATRAQRLV
ncbi:hypothetical protein ONA91_13795 [Micromonospora sp. DR5-3]|uniref:hypothetical protein n=1 Tax=unclassified Micromonospora TaxID=2617518 RepID=UPI0011D7C04C|nr:MULTISPECIES: hypothetical protein [unclassified Micromonospora]MCW3815527.1 hypothetical protein [Micromonospora sp. DR5-3]TYC24333.1 hypothetical protein FXF52_11335 [Micromonospora sp. MP36]